MSPASIALMRWRILSLPISGGLDLGKTLSMLFRYRDCPVDPTLLITKHALVVRSNTTLLGRRVTAYHRQSTTSHVYRGDIQSMWGCKATKIKSAVIGITECTILTNIATAHSQDVALAFPLLVAHSNLGQRTPCSSYSHRQPRYISSHLVRSMGPARRGMT